MKIIAPRIGKADCFVILHQGKCMLIDTGESDDFHEISSILLSEGVTHIDVMLITHFDKDHVGSAADLLNKYGAGKIYVNDRKKNSEEYQAFAEASGSMDKTVVTEDTEFDFGDIRVQIFAPDAEKYSEDDQNNASLVTRLTMLGRSYLFTGDVLDERIASLLAEDKIAVSDFLKIPHHGSWSEEVSRLIDAASPRVALVTCSQKNPPDQELLDRLKEMGIKTLVTSDGNVILTQNGKDLMY